MTNWWNLLRYFFIKDVKSKYAGSVLGLVWSFILPIFQIAIYWFVFSVIFKARPYTSADMPYIYYLLSGFFFWTAFSEALMRAGSCIIENAELVKKVPFNNSLLPVALTLSSYLHHLIGAAIFLLIFSIDGYFHTGIILVIPILFLQVIFSIGSGLIIAAIVPYVRDLLQLLGYILQGMFFIAPIIYSIDAIPERFRMLVYLNPVTPFIDSYHKVILENTIPSISTQILMLSFAILSLLIGIRLFNRLREGFPDIL